MLSARLTHTRAMAPSYRDQVTITFHQIADNIDPRVLDTAQIVVSLNGQLIDLEWLNDEIESIFQPEVDGERRLEPNYRLVQRRSEHHWGAAGAQASFFVETAAHVSAVGVDTVIALGITALVKKLQKAGFTVRYGKEVALTHEEIGLQGAFLISEEFEIPVSELTVSKTDRTVNREYMATATGPNGSAYTVNFVRRGTGNELRSSSHERPPIR